MKILYSSLYQINHFNETISEVDITGTSPDLAEYIDTLFYEITNKPNIRNFIFGSDTTEVRNTIDKYLQNDFKNASEINARRLLRIETQAQKDISQLSVEIQKGSLFQAYIQDGDTKKVIISKADHSDFLDEADFKRHAGLPLKKKIYKAFIAEINTANQISKVYVYDTNSLMSKYWWRDFLELSETYTDSYNTKQALDLLDRKIFNPIKYQFPADHTILRNSTVRYFRSQDEFDLSNYISNVFENYSPVESGFPQENLIGKISELPEKWGFDARFKIKKEDIGRRIVNRIQLTDKIDLILNDYVEDLESIIVPATEIDGKKYIKIYSDKGYERFRNRETIQ
jgi:hypothetical protein